jgi:hypothetical protein
METDADRIAAHALELRSAARRLAGAAADPSSVGELPAALGRVEEALDALSLVFERAPHSLVPPGDPYEPVCRRFERAAADWPETHGCEGPSYERQAQLLSTFYETGATLRLSRRACARANELLAGMTALRDPHADHEVAVGNGSTATG